MTGIALKHFQRVDLRDAWANEASDFTPWLAKPEHFAALSEALHFVEPEIEGTEQSIGSFSADIVAKDREGYILVENQLEQTDHNHLGQILTYLAGLEGPAKVVWISTQIREEHRAAIDWLNANTVGEYSFFAVELELLRIGDSPAAPLFNVVAKPNDWSRHISGRARQLSDTPLDDRQRRYLEFWTAFSDYASQHDGGFSAKPPKDHWLSLGIGRTGFALTLIAGVRDRWLGAELYIHDDPDKAIIDHLMCSKDIIENEFCNELDWERLEGKKASRIAFRWREVDPMDKERWPEYFEWYLLQLNRFRDCFALRVRELDLDSLLEATHSG